MVVLPSCIHLKNSKRLNKKLIIDNDQFMFGSLLPDTDSDGKLGRFKAHYYGNLHFPKCPNENRIDIDSFLDEKMLAKMFKIVSVNMSKLYNSKITDADFEIWSNNVSNNPQLKTIINYDGDLNGYIQYMEFANEKKICICEFEIISTKQGNGITFNKLLKEFLNEHKSEKYNNYIVYGNISNSNIHSQDVFKHLGFKNIEKNIYQIDLSLLQQTKIN